MWEVGKIYLMQNGDRVRILATDLTGAYPIAGARLADGDGRTEDEVETWMSNGTFHFGATGNTLNLTEVEAE